jgi:hypothetical protein
LEQVLNVKLSLGIFNLGKLERFGRTKRDHQRGGDGGLRIIREGGVGADNTTATTGEGASNPGRVTLLVKGGQHDIVRSSAKEEE